MRCWIPGGLLWTVLAQRQGTVGPFSSATGIKVTQYSDRGFDLPTSRFGLDSARPNLLGASLTVV